MQTSVITEQPELMQFLEMAAEGLGDPSLATCLLFVRYHENVVPVTPPALLASWDTAAGALRLELLGEPGRPSMLLPLPIADGEMPEVVDGKLAAFGLRKVARGLWALDPSLNMPGDFHGYVVVHGVPDPAPWERLVLLASEVAGGSYADGGRLAMGGKR